MGKSYLKIIKESSLLEKFKDEENYKFIPLFELGNKVQEEVNSLMKNNSKIYSQNGFDISSNKHFALSKDDPVSKDCKTRTIFFIERQLKHTYEPKDDKNSAIFYFWTGAKKGKNPNFKIAKSYQFPPLPFLNLISKAVGYKGFEDFFNKFFYTSETIKIIILPFLAFKDKPTFVQDQLSYEFNLFHKEKLLSLNVVKLVSKDSGLFNNLNWSKVSEIGAKFHGDLIIWGRIDQNNLIHVCCHALKPEISFFWSSNPLDSHSLDLNDQHSKFLENFKKSLLWATGIRWSLKKEYRKSIIIFRKLLNDNFQPLEVNLCLAVIYQLKKYPKYVDHHVIATIAYALEKSHDEVKELLIKKSSKYFQKLSLIDHLIKDWKHLKVKEKPDEKTQIWKLSGMIYFEFVAALILLGYKEFFTPKIYESLLHDIFRKIDKSWFKSIYGEVFAKVYFELGRLKEKRLLTSPELSPEDIYELYKEATLYSLDKNIHHTCKEFYIKYGQLEKIKNALRNSNNKSKVIQHFYLLASD